MQTIERGSIDVELHPYHIIYHIISYNHREIECQADPATNNTLSPRATSTHY